MHMKHLFDGDAWTTAASKLENDTREALQPVLDKYLGLGYNSREVEYAIQSAIYLFCCEYRLIGNKAHNRINRELARNELTPSNTSV